MRSIAALTAVAVTSAGIAVLGAAGVRPAAAQRPTAPHAELIAPGLAMPAMDPERGKQLFASKGCVVCHSINGIGGTDAPKLDASTMKPAMNPFEFFAKMWRGATSMIMMQQHELGHQIEFTGQDLADIVAFVHDSAAQKTFTASDIPPPIMKLMEGGDEPGPGGGPMGHGMMGGSGMGGMMGTVGARPGASAGQSAPQTSGIETVCGFAGGNPTHGAAIYARTCIACHGADGRGRIPGMPDFTKKGGVLSQPHSALQAHIERGFSSPNVPIAMPPRGGNPGLTDQDIRDVHAYLHKRFGCG